MKTKLIFFCLLLCGLCSGGLTAKQDGPKPRFYPARYGQGMYNNSFDGGAAFPLPVSINPARGTVEIWFTMKEDLKPYYGYRTLFSVQNLDAQGERQNCISLVITPKDGYYEESLKFTVVSPQGKRHDIYLKSPAWKKGEHHHIAGVWGGNGMYFYFDGKLVGSLPYKGGFQPTGSYFSIGRLLNHVTTDSFLIIDELRISDNPKTAAEITAVQNSTVAPAVENGTLVLCHFDGSLEILRNENAVRRLAKQGNFYLPFKSDSGNGNVFVAGEEVSLNAIFVSPHTKPGKFDIVTVVRNMENKEMWRGTVTVAPPGGLSGSPFQVKLPFKDKIGWYSVRMYLRHHGYPYNLAIRETSFMVLPEETPCSYTLAADAITSSMPWEAMAKCGFKVVRMHQPWKWPMIEYAPGKYDFSDSDYAVQKSTETGIKLVATLGWVPRWEAQRPDNYNDFIGKQNERNMTSAPHRWRPKDLERYRKFLNMLYTRHKGKVHYYEHYNEPDWHLPGSAGCGFAGSTAQFFDLMKVQYEEMKKCDPKAIMLFPGISATPSSDGKFAPDLLKMGAMKYFDIVGMHGYGGVPYFLSLVNVFRKHGYKGPIWCSERYISPNAWYRQVPDILNFLSNGVHTYVVHDQTILWTFGHPQPHAFTISYFYRMIGDKKYTGRLKEAEVYFFTNGKKQLVVASGKHRKLQTGCSRVQVTDLLGRSSVVETDKGFIALDEKVQYLTPVEGEKFDFAKFSAVVPGLAPLQNGNFEKVDGDAGMGVLYADLWEFGNDRYGTMRIDNIIRAEGRHSLNLIASKHGATTYRQVLFAPLEKKKWRFTAKIRVDDYKPAHREPRRIAIMIWSRSLSRMLGMISLAETEFNTREFKEYKVEFTAPAGAVLNVLTCQLLSGTGQVWFDDLRLEEIK